MPASQTIGRWLTWGMITLLIVSLGVWLVRRDRLPTRIRIASGEENGLYHSLGESLQESLSESLGRKVELLTTDGSLDNFARLKSDRAELAIVQGGAVKLEELTVVTPLYPEWMIVIARRDRGVKSIFDLIGRKVALGKQGSGMRASATHMLNQLRVDVGELTDCSEYFTAILEDDSIDAAIVTTGVANADLRRVLQSRQFEIVPIHVAPALELQDPYFRAVQAPAGVFGARPPIPAEDVPTVATVAYLAAKPTASRKLIAAALSAIHEENLRLRTPMLIDRASAPSVTSTRFHSVSQRYFQPGDEIGFMANVMESLAAGKELLFAIGAGVYLLWRRWRLLKDQETQSILSRQKEHLDVFLEKTLAIEAAQMKTSDVEELQGYLNEVTDLKLQALHEFTEEELRGDRVFQIFLMQCANLISKIQLKIISLHGPS